MISAHASEDVLWSQLCSLTGYDTWSIHEQLNFPKAVQLTQDADNITRYRKVAGLRHEWYHSMLAIQPHEGKVRREVGTSMWLGSSPATAATTSATSKINRGEPTRHHYAKIYGNHPIIILSAFSSSHALRRLELSFICA